MSYAVDEFPRRLCDPLPPVTTVLYYHWLAAGLHYKTISQRVGGHRVYVGIRYPSKYQVQARPKKSGLSVIYLAMIIPEIIPAKLPPVPSHPEVFSLILNGSTARSRTDVQPK